MLATDLVFDTPFGRSPAFTHFRVEGAAGPREALAVKMHGWRRGVKRADASLQAFWVFHEAGVRKVLADGGVGSLNHLLDPRDIVIPNDFIDLSIKQDIYVRGDHLLIMRQPICPDMAATLYRGALGAELPARLPARHLPRHRRPALRVARRGRLHEAPRRRRHRPVALARRSSSRATSARASPASTSS